MRSVCTLPGTDAGAGIDQYAAFVSEAGGAFSLWTVTADTSAVFEGKPGRTYGFYVTARDGAGNREPGKSEAEVTVETVVGVEDDAGAGLPAAFALHQNQPNPFNPRSVIRYDVREHAHVTLTVFDATGRAVTKLVDVRQTPGRYTAAFDAGALASGVYFYRIEMGGFSAVKRMVLVR